MTQTRIDHTHMTTRSKSRHKKGLDICLTWTSEHIKGLFRKFPDEEWPSMTFWLHEMGPGKYSLLSQVTKGLKMVNTSWDYAASV